MVAKDYLPAFCNKCTTMSLKLSSKSAYFSQWTHIFCFGLFCSRLCAAGVPQYPETLPHGGHEDPGHASDRQPSRSGGGTSQDGDPHHGRPAPGGAATQAEAQRHEHPDTVRLLRSHSFGHMASIAACYISS